MCGKYDQEMIAWNPFDDQQTTAASETANVTYCTFGWTGFCNSCKLLRDGIANEAESKGSVIHPKIYFITLSLVAQRVRGTDVFQCRFPVKIDAI